MGKPTDKILEDVKTYRMINANLARALDDDITREEEKHGGRIPAPALDADGMDWLDDFANRCKLRGMDEIERYLADALGEIPETFPALERENAAIDKAIAEGKIKTVPAPYKKD